MDNIKITKDELAALKIVYRYMARSEDIYNDIHDKNIMKRSDGTLVITDPYIS